MTPATPAGAAQPERDAPGPWRLVTSSHPDDTPDLGKLWEELYDGLPEPGGEES